ncbi:hypothetical protein SVAN01_01665 [Stagonosporopsis vannaccii]|nr:hypothetical protein SVAN01_01665 [Stagonosporopsis vannaccii]
MRYGTIKGSAIGTLHCYVTEKTQNVTHRALSEVCRGFVELKAQLRVPASLSSGGEASRWTCDVLDVVEWSDRAIRSATSEGAEGCGADSGTSICTTKETKGERRKSHNLAWESRESC